VHGVKLLNGQDLVTIQHFLTVGLYYALIIDLQAHSKRSKPAWRVVSLCILTANQAPEKNDHLIGNPNMSVSRRCPWKLHEVNLQHLE
jgi:hypothetical protein